MLEAQLKERKIALKKKDESPSKEALRTIDEHIENIDSIQDFLVRPEDKPSISEGSRLSGQLSSLFWSIDGVNAAPTKAQIEYFGELEEKFRKSLSDVNFYLSQSVKELNKELEKNRVHLVLVPGAIELSEK